MTLCVSMHMSTVAHWNQKRASDLRELEFQVAVNCWEMTSHHLQKQYRLLTTEPSAQSKTLNSDVLISTTHELTLSYSAIHKTDTQLFMGSH